MGLLNIIRKLRFRQGLPIREPRTTAAQVAVAYNGLVAENSELTAAQETLAISEGLATTAYEQAARQNQDVRDELDSVLVARDELDPEPTGPTTPSP